jgi:hypothetical protein
MKNVIAFAILFLSIVGQSHGQAGGISNYYYYYPRHTELYIQKADVVESKAVCVFEIGTSKNPESVYVNISSHSLASPEALDSIVLTVKPPAPALFQRFDIKKPLVLSFEENGKPDIQLIDVHFMIQGAQPVFYHMSLTYYPNEFYQQSKSSTSRRIILRSKNLVINSSSISEWQNMEPTKADIDYANARWKNILKNSNSNHEKAKEIIKKMKADLSGKFGVPPDSLNVRHPFDQYDMTVEGKGEIWCTNTALMFTYLTNCLGIPSRQVGTGKNNISGDIMLWTNDGHTTTEIYDDKSEKWIWVDVGYGIAGIRDFKAHYLSVTELCYAMNDKMVTDRLVVSYYDRGKLRHKKLKDYEFESSITNYFGRNQSVFFYHKDKYPIEVPVRVGQTK